MPDPNRAGHAAREAAHWQALAEHVSRAPHALNARQSILVMHPQASLMQ
jgi:hypothetical protein